MLGNEKAETVFAVVLATLCVSVIIVTVVLLWLSSRKGKKLVLTDTTPQVVRPKWDDYFLGITLAVSARGDCTRSQVGALLVKDRRFLSGGYNGTEPGLPSCLQGACPRGRLSYAEVPALSSYTDGEGACIAIHAEDNALRYAQKFYAFEDIKGSTMYITREPCPDCDRKLRAVGIQHVVWPEGDRYYDDWELVEPPAREEEAEDVPY